MKIIMNINYDASITILLDSESSDSVFHLKVFPSYYAGHLADKEAKSYARNLAEYLGCQWEINNSFKG